MHDMQHHHGEPESETAVAVHETTARSHDKHAGHTPEMFRDRLWISLLLTIPIVYLSGHFQDWFDYHAVEFPGDAGQHHVGRIGLQLPDQVESFGHLEVLVIVAVGGRWRGRRKRRGCPEGGRNGP